MESGVFMLKDGLPKLLKGLHQLPKRGVLVGIPAAKGPRDEGDPVNNAALGYIHEFGAPEANIPARPFLIPGVRSATDRVAISFRRAGEAALSGNNEKAEASINAAGMAAVASVQRRLTDGPFVPLAETTLAARRRRGVTRTKPLIDTGQLRRAVTYVLRKP